MVKAVFLIDDDDDDRDLFRDALAIYNPCIEMLSACDGVEALRILRLGSRRPDVIFLDYNMPKMNGLECLKELKTEPLTRDIPVIMYTTSGNPDHEKTILRNGASYYMKKTFTFPKLCTELKRLLDLVASQEVEKAQS